MREEFGLEEGDEIRWHGDEEGIRIWKAAQSAGRGILVNDDITDEKREEMATEMESDIRKKRQTEWQP